MFFDVKGAAGFYRLKKFMNRNSDLSVKTPQELQALTVKMLTSGLGIAVV